jgi:competence protein ComEC
MPHPSHIAPLLQALRTDGVILAAAAGALVGAGAFFGLPFEPPLWPGLLLSLVWVGFFWAGRWRSLVAAVGMAGVLWSLAWGQLVSLEQPQWATAASKPHWLVGRVVAVDEKTVTGRVTLGLSEVQIYGLRGFDTVREARIGVPRGQVAAVQLGAGVALPVMLLPPQGPRFPGDGDARWWRFFQRETVYGYARGEVETTSLPDAPTARWEGVWVAVETLRTHVKHVTQPLAQGVVAALLMGDQRAVQPAVREAYRATGMSHLLAISGMQLSLVAGGIFWLVRWLMALGLPRVATRYDTKWAAAVVGLLAAGGYTLLAGAGVSVVRSLVMVSLLFAAILLGRMRTALRAWGLGVVVILLVNPALVAHAGFQLSFAAVLGLIVWALVLEKPHGVFGWIYTLGLSSVVAGAMTAPLLVWNFGQLSGVNLLANMVAVPLMAVVTYVGMLGLVLWPVGLAEPVLQVMAWLVEGVNAWALWLATWPGSGARLASDWWPLVLVLSGWTLGAVLYQRWGQVAGGVVLSAFAALVLPWWQGEPEVRVWDGGSVALVRVPERGAFRVAWVENPRELQNMLQRRPVRLVSETWPVGQSVKDELWPLMAPEDFAWAERTAGRWVIAPVPCGRVWQRGAPECWGAD